MNRPARGRGSQMYCPQCGAQLPEGATRCPQCKFIVVFPALTENIPYVPEPTDATTRMLLPVGRSGWAIAAGYLGLLSLMGIFAPFAVLCGILAIREIRTDPNLHGMGRAIFGIVMGSLFSILYGVALLVAIFAPGY